MLAVLLVHTAALHARLAALLATVRREADSVRTLQLEERERVFETSKDLILVTDTAGTFIQVSPSSITILGYQPAEMIGHSAIEFIHPDDLENTRKEMRSARRGQQKRNFETRYVHKDGHDVVLEWTGSWSRAGAAAFLHRPRPDGEAGRGSPDPAGAEDGSGRPADRRHRARLQQHPDGHHRAPSSILREAVADKPELDRHHAS